METKDRKQELKLQPSYFVLQAYTEYLYSWTTIDVFNHYMTAMDHLKQRQIEQPEREFRVILRVIQETKRAI